MIKLDQETSMNSNNNEDMANLSYDLIGNNNNTNRSNYYVIQNIVSPFVTSNAQDPIYLRGVEFYASQSGQITIGVSIQGFLQIIRCLKKN
jgi:hypothetical protein